MVERLTGSRIAVVVSLMLVASCLLHVPAIGAAQGGACPEPNDDLNTACRLTPGTTVSETIDRAGDRDVFRVSVPASGQLRITLTGLPADYDLYLMNEIGGVLGQSVHEGTAPESLEIVAQAGEYFVVVQADPEREVDAGRPYTLGLTVTSESTLPAPAASVPLADARRVLAEDNFDDPAVGFMPRASVASDLELGHVDGEYMIRNLSETIQARGPVLPGVFSDASIALDARIVGDTDGRRINVRCREQILSRSPFVAQAYQFTIWPDAREFDLRRSDGTTSVTLAARRGLPEIRPGGGSNHIELRCIKSRIVASANDFELAAVDDATYTSGTFVITAGGPDGAMPRSDLRLDNLVIRGP